MEYVALNDYSQALSYSSFIHPYEIIHSKTFRKKSALIMYIIERRVGADGFRRVHFNYIGMLMTLYKGGFKHSITTRRGTVR